MKLLATGFVAAAVLMSGPSPAQEPPPFAPVVTLGGETQVIYPGDSPVEILVPEAASGGQFGMAVVYTKPNEGPGKGMLTEQKLTETFYVLEGEHRFFVGDEVYDGGPGTVVVNPPRVPHGFTYIGTGIGKLLVLYTPVEDDDKKGTGFFVDWANQSTRSPAWIEKTNAAFGIVRAAK